MAAIGRASGNCCGRLSATALQGLFCSTDRTRCSRKSLVACTSFAVLKPISAGLSTLHFAKRARLRFTEKTLFSRTPRNSYEVVGLCYQAAGGTAYATKNSTTPQGAYEQYGEQQQRGIEGLPPPVIPWDKSLANGVQLIGNVGRDVEIRYLDSGKVCARTSIAVRRARLNNANDPSWFEVEFWDALAEIAAHHVKKGQQIFVSGTIVVDKWEKDEIKYRVAKVIATDLCLVESQSGLRRSTVPQSEIEYEEMSPSSESANWNQQQGLRQSPQGTVGQRGSNKGSSEAALATEKRWQEFFADPSQWWDNRHNKRNPKAPDFKHKGTQEALWVESWSNPSWVQQQLMVLENAQAQHTAANGRSHQQQPLTKKLTSFQDSDFIY